MNQKRVVESSAVNALEMGGAVLPALVPLLAEIGDLKRVRAAGRPGTHAEGVFRRSWAALLGGKDVESVARREAASVVAAARAGSRDFPMLRRAGLSTGEAIEVLVESFDSVTSELSEELRMPLREDLRTAPVIEEPPGEERLPAFVGLLARQPRAGATAPGKPRVMLEPPESHADHCATVALYAAILAPVYEARPGVPFILGLAHHLHNAVFPDSGFAGDELLGAHLPGINQRFAAEALEEIQDLTLQSEIARALPLVQRADTPEARAFQAADVLDRVLQMRHHARAVTFTLEEAMEEMNLIHEGPRQAFHLQVLNEAGLR